ncbi:GNAT superfamily N-acetyltransferase [Nocardiopsis mwathae]|uniref:GNAT superfamily N-acetyltransferase n=1 Tax=Nocardiopsis mwathae TaxID=1472723 RepID=A0A7X0D572_9ACTN|nr:GNAT family N-acetyltransferase [Nocardiopsis mwathae]MBB6172082.1 GNAT superfamily N-acetyltransferase [Nocardiopsis mwathae]
MALTIRPAVAADLPGLLALYRELNPDDPPLPQDSADRIWADIAVQRGRTVLVADQEGTPVGTADCTVLPNLTRGGRSILLVENVVVAAAHRRRGIGRRLMGSVVRLAESNGCYKVQLLAADEAEAHLFYRSCGFGSTAPGFRRYLARP